MSFERKTLVIERLPQGGFVVAELAIPDGRPVFASLELDDALDFVACQLDPMMQQEEAVAVPEEALGVSAGDIIRVKTRCPA